MNLKDFNNQYMQRIDEFLEDVEPFYTDEGRCVALIYKATIQVERAPLYVLPPEIIEFLSIPPITKLYAYPIVPELKLKIKWNNKLISEMNGNRMLPMDMFWDAIECDGCAAEITGNYYQRWYVPNVGYDLCKSCYANERFGPFTKKDFIYFYIPENKFLGLGTILSQ